MSLPLSGVRVLDFSRVLAGPFATMILGDLGADVVKVEPPQGDDTRYWSPPEIRGIAAYFLSTNRNKRSIVIDLKKPESRLVVERLAKWADIVVENFRPGVAERLGIDYATLSRINPKIIYCSISGFGQTGPYREKPAYDLIIQALSGHMSITGEPGRPPVKFGVPITDLTSGMMAVIAILAALHQREKTGVGQYIDVSMLDTQVYLLVNQAYNYFATGRDPERLGSAHPNIAPYQVFTTSDGYVAVAVGNDKLWVDFCKALGRQDLLENPRFKTNELRVTNRRELVEEIEEIFSRMTTSEVVELLERAGVPCGPVKKISEVLSDPQVLHRGMVTKMRHPVYGEVPALGVPLKSSVTGFEIRRAPPLKGEHTREVLREVGFTDEEIESLIAMGVVETERSEKNP
ncbi:MAG: CoA transferase [Fervidicoccaceae archaeon]